MKSNYIIMGALALCSIALLPSCGSSKSSVAPSIEDVSRGKAIQTEKCYLLQSQKPQTRAVGNGRHFRESTALNIAMAQAKANFAKSIASVVTSGLEEYAEGHNQYAGDDYQGSAVSDQGSKVKDYVRELANEIVENTMVIETSMYFLPNRQFNVYVCMEYKGSAADIAQNITQKIKPRIPESAKQQLEKNEEKFKTFIEEKIGENNAGKQ